jgi:hypothetical protein
MKLGRAAGDVQRRNAAAGKKAQHGLDCLPAHHFFARWAGFDVAVNTGQIAVAPQIDLQNFDCPTPKPGAVGPQLLDKGLHENAYD